MLKDENETENENENKIENQNDDEIETKTKMKNESGNIRYQHTKNTVAVRVERKGEVLIADSQISSFNDQHCRDISNQI